ncbi:MAG: tetratricopeptide repeat protein [Treponema sp.]|nr:tetratricopeptide repeat protein [Treponema sp.]
MKALKLPLAFLILLSAAGGLYAQNTAGDWYGKGRGFMVEENWYSAAEAFLECLRLNPAHAEGTFALSECYYQLGEFDQALSWVRKARSLARSSMAVANMEASILIALGRLDAAQTLIREILAKEPYNREALFASAELDIGRGRVSEALLRLRDANRRYPDDRRILLSLALVAFSLGDRENARLYIEDALRRHEGDYRVYYYAAYLDAQDGNVASGIANAENCLFYRPGFAPARSLLASLRYRAGQWEEAARLADESIAADRNDAGAWYLKGLAYSRMGRFSDAINILSTGADIDREDEFIRSSLEDLIINNTTLEDSGRSRLASWHFERAGDYRSRNLAEEALFEYRRGLRLNPYAKDRRDYAELLRLGGYPARYLEELRFLQNLGLSDRSIDDAVEAYTSVLAGTLHQRWNVDPVMAAKRHWKLAIFSVSGQSSFPHADAGAVASAYIRELLSHHRNLECIDLEFRQPSFSAAYRLAREAGADYFLIVSVRESDRDISIQGDLHVGRTGSAAASFSVFRTGTGRLRSAGRGIVSRIDSVLPFRAELLSRRQAQGLIDKGKADGVKEGDVFDIVHKGTVRTHNEGSGLVYSPQDVTGTFTVTSLGEEVSQGTLVRKGFFDRIEAGDEIIPQPGENSSAENTPPGVENPELEALLRTLR